MWNNILLITLIIICTVTDLRERKIYNNVLFPALAAAWIIHTLTGGMYGLVEALSGTAAGLGILLIPYLLGGMGAGDVKLLAVIGGIKGAGFVMMASLYMAVAGGIMALFVFFLHRGGKGRIIQIIYFFHGLFTGIRFPILANEEAMKTTYPYGVAIAAGTLYQVYSMGGFLK